jgi:hypothetical protein
VKSIDNVAISTVTLIVPLGSVSMECQPVVVGYNGKDGSARIGSLGTRPIQLATCLAACFVI